MTALQPLTDIQVTNRLDAYNAGGKLERDIRALWEDAGDLIEAEVRDQFGDEAAATVRNRYTMRVDAAWIQAVAESAMRGVVSRSQLSPILNRDRGLISQEVKDLVQQTLDEYGSGVNIVRVNFDRADPPQQVIDAFREVQAARQERSTLQNQADAYANKTLAAARGTAAQRVQEAEGYRAQVVNAAQGEASRFTAVQEEYVKAPEVTRKRLYLETMQDVLGNVRMFVLDTPNSNGTGILPYLPLNELKTTPPATTGENK